MQILHNLLDNCRESDRALAGRRGLVGLDQPRRADRAAAGGFGAPGHADPAARPLATRLRPRGVPGPGRGAQLLGQLVPALPRRRAAVESDRPGPGRPGPGGAGHECRELPGLEARAVQAGVGDRVSGRDGQRPLDLAGVREPLLAGEISDRQRRVRALLPLRRRQLSGDGGGRTGAAA